MNPHISLFERIALPYSFFFNLQLKNYLEIFQLHGHKLDLRSGIRVLDIGCGTGAFTAALEKQGCEVVGIDAAGNMVRMGRKRALNCLRGNILQGLPYADRSFDLVTAAHVLHGIPSDERKILFEETSRLSAGCMLFHDYSSRRSRWIDLVEWLEQGDYFGFIETGLDEMTRFFRKVDVVDVGEHHAWYLCRS